MEAPFNTTSTVYPEWYNPHTGIYHSMHPSRTLPTDPFMDIVSFIFSHPHNGSLAFIDSSSGFSISYSKLFSLIKSMAFGLQNIGVSHGDVVLILLPNGVYYPVILLSLLYLGAIVTPLNPLSSVEEIEKRVKDCNGKLAFSLCDKVDALKVLGVRVIKVPDDSLNLDIERTEFADFFKLVSCDSSLVQRPVIMQDDTAAILYSSGTTGVSKGVVLTHRCFIAVVELFVRFDASRYGTRGSENVYLASLPMFHIYGMALFVMGLLSLGTSIVIMKKFDMNEALKAIEKYGVTHFPIVPPILGALTKASKGVDKNCLRSLKQVSCGGAPTSRRLIDEFTQSLPHVDFIQGYGTTESTGVGTRGFNTEQFKKYSSIGVLAPNMQAKIVDLSTGRFLPPGSPGELLLRGPGIMKGYLNNAEATSSTIDKEGWLHTGDVVYFDQDGYLYVSDRLKEMIKYKGFQIAPADLESVLLSHPDIVDAGVTALIDEEMGEIPVAFVVRRNGSSLSEASVIDFVAAQVAPYKKVRKVVFISSLPKSPIGKILRRKLRNSLSSKL